MADTRPAAEVGPAPESSSTLTGLLGAALAVTAWGSASVLVKAVDMGGLAVAVYRFLLHFAVLSLWMSLRGAPFTLRVVRRSAFGGIALALDVAFFFTAVKETSVINATLIGALQPILVGVVAARFFGERIRSRDALWSIVALAGVFTVVVAAADSAVSSVKGDLLAVAALLSWSAYFIASKRSKGSMTSTEFTAGAALWAGGLNLPLAIGFGQDLSPPSGRDLALILMITFVAGVFGHSLMNWSLVQIPLWVGSTFTLLIPVAASLIAWAFLGEPLTAGQMLGTAVVLGALAAIVVGQSGPIGGRGSRPTRPRSTNDESDAPYTEHLAGVERGRERWGSGRRPHTRG